MKKILTLISVVLLASCTTSSEDRAKLQKTYPIVYPLNGDNSNRYICIDSLNNVFDVRMDMNGNPYGVFKINK